MATASKSTKSKAFQDAEQSAHLCRTEARFAYEDLCKAFAAYQVARGRSIVAEQELRSAPEPSAGELLALLRRVDDALTREHTTFNRLDLGPVKLLVDVRTALGDPNPTEHGRQ